MLRALFDTKIVFYPIVCKHFFWYLCISTAPFGKCLWPKGLPIAQSYSFVLGFI